MLKIFNLGIKIKIHQNNEWIVINAAFFRKTYKASQDHHEL